MANLEPRIREIGNDLFARMKGEKPGLFDKAWWSGQILEWAMKDEAFKTEMFRFVDVFPVLVTPEEIARHIQEYLLRPGLDSPAVIKMALKGAGLGSMATRIAAGQIAKNLEGMARRFIVGTDAASAVGALREMRATKQAFTVDLLGEATVSEPETEAYVARYRDLMEGLSTECATWKNESLLDSDDRGSVPRVNVSIKVSALYSQLDPLSFDASVEAASRRLLPLFQRARQLGVFLNLDMEQRSLVELTYAIFQRVMGDPSLADYEHAGVVVQAYLRDSEAHLDGLIKWAKKKSRRVTVRLVKGAYWDYETVRATQEGWPSPVWLEKGDSDANFELLADKLLDHHKYLRTAIGSHNLRSLSHAMAVAEHRKVPINGYELQCLFGMAEPIKAACVQRGHRVRVYAPIGELLPGMAYLVRRLLENTSNQSWLRLGFVEGRGHESLLAAPTFGKRSPLLRPVLLAETLFDAKGTLPAFCNEPLRDFGEAAQRAAFALALTTVEKTLGRTITAVVDGKAAVSTRTLTRLDPADGRTLIGTAALCSIEDADRAVKVARASFAAWRDVPTRERASCLLRLAALMRRQRDALSALMVREVGKPWREADADVCEAIDFCEYYAREAMRLFSPREALSPPGESNLLTMTPRGVTAVIGPWNFPLAILTGMAVAPLVCGNPVILKPAEQSFVIAARLFELLLEAKVPAGVVHFLPGLGEEVGAHLCAHPDVTNIVFTGSMAVGLEIWRQAGITHAGQRGLKRVVCEMGGKNALVIDNDADLDEAVLGTMHSAFGFSGQKCSACSRVIVLADHYDAFVSRLVEATRSLKIGAPSDAATRIGPVVDAESRTRLLRLIDEGAKRCRKLCGGGVEGPGHYIEPTIFVDVPPDDPLARDELFGPVLMVIKARTYDEALALALDSPYALTGGVYSRSPAHLEQARQTFRVGNLYLNRPITGAVVGRHPFGGFGMSGGGTKAGGPDYLLNFVDPRVVSENTMRRGFVPQSEA